MYSNSIPSKNKYEIYFDGCSKGNPGLAGAGAVLYENSNEIEAISLFVGENETNNVAEYRGLILALTIGIRNNNKEVTIKGDSLLVIQQMTGNYQVKSNHLIDLYLQAKELEKWYTKVEYKHVIRSDNKRADTLANDATITYSSMRTSRDIIKQFKEGQLNI